MLIDFVPLEHVPLFTAPSDDFILAGVVTAWHAPQLDLWFKIICLSQILARGARSPLTLPRRLP
jgi:hypothetical protein